MPLNHAEVGVVELMVAKGKNPASTHPETKEKGAVPHSDSGANPEQSTLRGIPEDMIGERIKEAREALGMTQVGLAGRSKVVDRQGVGISRTVIVGYEAGTHKPGAREIRILCETLGVTPNWLLYRKEAPFETIQTSMVFMRGNDEIVLAIRLAFAALLLQPHERDLIASLVLSLGGRELGDARLSGLLTVASLIATEVKKELVTWSPDGDSKPEDMREFVKFLADQMTTNWGNKIRLDENGEVIGGEWLYRDPSGTKKKAKPKKT